MKPEIPEVDTAEVRHTAVSVYGDAMDDFPVLKAFQQYIDAEQAKARKRLLAMGVFFGVFMLCVIAVFVAMLHGASQRNQMLNDRLVEYAMRDRERQSAVVVQPPAQQDNSAILALTAKIEDMQQKLTESQRRAEEAERARREAAAAKAAEEAKKPKAPSAEEVEIRRLRALLAAEKEKLAAEREKLAAEQERRRKEELEAYRRKQYPELYEPAKPKPRQRQAAKAEPIPKAAKTEPIPKAAEETAAEDGLDELDDSSAISYFSEESAPTGEKAYAIPVDVRGTKSKWRIPKD